MQILEKLVQLAQISGGVNVHCRFQGEFYVKHEQARAQAVAHIVLSGEGYVKLPDEAEGRKLQTGDVLFFSRSAEHILSNQPQCDNPNAATRLTSRATPLTGIIEKQGSVGEGNLRLLCAHFYYDKRSDLFKNLPNLIWLSLPQTTLQPLITLLTQEVEKGEDSSTLVIDNLSNVLLISLLRHYLTQQPNQANGILNSGGDSRLRPLLEQIMSEPAKLWSVDQMAAVCTVSRAQLMRLFKQKLDASPHAFVHRIRLQKAAQQLKQCADSVLAIALTCGFQSETHFCKAFKAMYGCTPSAYRKSNQQTDLELSN